MSKPEKLPDNFIPYGYFYTQDNSTIEVEGPEQPIYYLRNIYEDQYQYFTVPSRILTYMEDDLSDDNGEFRLRVFYDKLED